MNFVCQVAVLRLVWIHWECVYTDGSVRFVLQGSEIVAAMS